MSVRVFCLTILAGLIAVFFPPAPASSQDLNRVVRELNRVLNPDDARRYEEQARRNHRLEEERYWRDYRVGLEAQRGDRGREIGPDQARRFEDESRRRRRFEEERYWRDYRAGLERQPGADRGFHAIGPDEARRLEEQSRRNRRHEEERYWRDYGRGLDEGRR